MRNANLRAATHVAERVSGRSSSIGSGSQLYSTLDDALYLSADLPPDADVSTSSAHPLAPVTNVPGSKGPRRHSVGSVSDFKTAASQIVQTSSASTCFRTLRDMHADPEFDYIAPEKLEFVRVLGEGGFAIVEECIYSPAVDTHKYHVAVKRLKHSALDAPLEEDLLLREVALLKKLDHKYVVHYIGAGRYVDGPISIPYVVQEMMDGGSVKSLIWKQMHSPSLLYRYEDATRWLIQLAQALRYLHNATPTVIHRDVKGDNALFKGTQTSTASCLLGDVGLSALVRRKPLAVRASPTPSSTPAHLSPTSEAARGSPRSPNLHRGSLEDEAVWSMQAKELMQRTAKPLVVRGSYDQLTGRTGTLSYMAPEVYRGGAYNEKADVFSFAVLMYELLHRFLVICMLASRSEPEEEKYCRRVSCGFRPPVSKALPALLADLIRDCWAQDPADRPTMDVVVQRLVEVRDIGLAQAMDEAVETTGSIKLQGPVNRISVPVSSAVGNGQAFSAPSSPNNAAGHPPHSPAVMRVTVADTDRDTPSGDCHAFTLKMSDLKLEEKEGMEGVRGSAAGKARSSSSSRQPKHTSPGCMGCVIC